MNNSNLTCVVPTHNRPRFLRRLFHFYQQFPPTFPMMVVDSSAPSAAEENAAVVAEASKGLTVSYHHYDLNIVDKCVEGLKAVTTPFVVFCADDDVLFPDAVVRCAEFLAAEPGYSSAMGRSSQLKPELPPWLCRVLKGYTISDDQPFERCRHLASNWFTNFYAVYRTETLLDIFQVTAANTNSSLSYYIPEMMLSQLSALRGRIKVLPVMYSLMERHSTNAGSGMRVGVRPQAVAQFERFKACLVDQYVQSGVEQEVADRFVEDTYDYFREPDWSVRRRPRSMTTAQILRRILGVLRGAANKAASVFGAASDRHRRFVRASDLVGCEPIWDAAVKLMRDFPLGIPADPSTLKRAA